MGTLGTCPTCKRKNLSTSARRCPRCGETEFFEYQTTSTSRIAIDKRTGERTEWELAPPSSSSSSEDSGTGIFGICIGAAVVAVLGLEVMGVYREHQELHPPKRTTTDSLEEFRIPSLKKAVRDLQDETPTEGLKRRLQEETLNRALDQDRQTLHKMIEDGRDKPPPRQR